MSESKEILTYRYFFNQELSKVKREGIDKLSKWLYDNNFYDSPCASKHHGNFKHGLLIHSVNVYKILKRISETLNMNLDEESLIIVSLLHDVCKLGVYWISDGKVKFNPKKAALGHGKRSIELIKQFIELKPHEEAAILLHMGIYGTYEIGTYIKEYPLEEMNHMFSNSGSFLIMGLHFADMISAHYIDK